MRVKHVTKLVEGDILAKPIKDQFGRILLQKDVYLTERLIKLLKQYYFGNVYVVDIYAEGIVSEEPISDELKYKAINQIRSTFNAFEHYIHGQQTKIILDESIMHIEETVNEIASVIKTSDMMLSIMSDIFVFDQYLYTHSLNVTLYSLVLAKKLNYNEKDMTELGIGALLHDIGKLKIPKEILNKPGALTKFEYEVVKEHTTYGYQLLKDVQNIPDSIVSCAYEHHERLNGTGYPRGLKDQDIHEYAKILMIADVFDAVTTDRSYRDAYLPHVGFEILYAGSGTEFNKSYIEAFRKSILLYPNGTYVRLSDGRAGIVAKQNRFFTDRPVVRVTEEHGHRLALNQVYEIDLSKHLNITISHKSSEYE